MVHNDNFPVENGLLYAHSKFTVQNYGTNLPRITRETCTFIVYIMSSIFSQKSILTVKAKTRFWIFNSCFLAEFECIYFDLRQILLMAKLLLPNIYQICYFYHFHVRVIQNIPFGFIILCLHNCRPYNNNEMTLDIVVNVCSINSVFVSTNH